MAALVDGEELAARDLRGAKAAQDVALTARGTLQRHCSILHELTGTTSDYMLFAGLKAVHNRPSESSTTSHSLADGISATSRNKPRRMGKEQATSAIDLFQAQTHIHPLPGQTSYFLPFLAFVAMD